MPLSDQKPSKQFPFFIVITPARFAIPVYITRSCLSLTLNFCESTELSNVVFLSQSTLDKRPAVFLVSINNLRSQPVVSIALHAKFNSYNMNGTLK